jgi:uncharacterized protein (TIGR03083 family)
MDAVVALDVLRDAAEELAGAAVHDLDRPVPTYPGWVIADLVLHTGRIHRWVAEIVRTRATRRLAQPDLAPPPDDVIAWFRQGAIHVADTLAATDASTPVWTFAGRPSVGFWRRRMALETTIHRWDAQRAFGAAAPIPDPVAVAGVSEALEVYLEPRLRGAAVGGAGATIGLATVDALSAWTVRLDTDAIEVLDTDGPVDVRVTATATDLWLFLMGRAGREALDVDGPARHIEVLERAVAMLPPPAR